MAWCDVAAIPNFMTFPISNMNAHLAGWEETL